MPLSPISPESAQKLMDQGALLIDIRAADEYAREHIAQAQHVPIEQLSIGHPKIKNAGKVIYHCRMGNRTLVNAQRLCSCTKGAEVFLLDGGLDAWKKAGLPVVSNRSQPLELQRQVQIAAGSLALVGTILGITASPWFHLVPGLIGTGFVFAGVSGFCGLARILMMAPWNRQAIAN